MTNHSLLFSSSPSMVIPDHKDHNINNNIGLSEDAYIQHLIAAVEKRPVLYNVHLLDYKNKNKKGEAFKEVQNVMRSAGCSENQVQGTYKKWISLKRKFRVEYFKPKSEDSREASCSFPYFESLKFLIPYCEVYKMCKTANKRKAEEYTGMNIEEDESDDDRYAPQEDEPYSAPSALDMLIGQKRMKFDTSSFMFKNNFLEQPESPPRSPTQSRASPQLKKSNVSASNTSTSSSSSKDVLNSLFPSPQEDLNSAMAAAAAAYLQQPADDSPNALFGRLVANELDKLPPPIHNIIRAQVLLLLAQVSQQNQNNVPNAPDRMFSCLTP
ncbi:unnamed protein product [Bursaphelenchus okinawaensis]|uniref:MADF domain-containing protein n=1 Tax=Bursaphelenchus okinawaensis TaxID=465554 RepID=A0A811LNX5_9BILA|nr:unnamed protein product [Bursaphelenchus okinawaensis]CAG9125874.1 unnamed protein product [Bursaphelenchus okinawaensis]